MGYRNKVYVSMDADTDIKYYYLMKAWKQNDNSSFNFYDAHDINNIYDKSEESIKAGLMERFRNSKVFVLLVGKNTKYLYKYVRWEIQQAINRKMPIIVVNLNGKRKMDDIFCPAIIKEHLAIHISFNKRILEYSLNNWPQQFENLKKNGEKGSYYYPDDLYEKLDI